METRLLVSLAELGTIARDLFMNREDHLAGQPELKIRKQLVQLADDLVEIQNEVAARGLSLLLARRDKRGEPGACGGCTWTPMCGHRGEGVRHRINF